MKADFSVEPSPIASLPRPRGFSRVSVQVRYDGVLLMLFVRDPGLDAVTETVAEGIGVFPRSRTQDPHAYRLYRLDGETCTYTDMPAVDITFPTVAAA